MTLEHFYSYFDLINVVAVVFNARKSSQQATFVRANKILSTPLLNIARSYPEGEGVAVMFKSIGIIVKKK